MKIFITVPNTPRYEGFFTDRSEAALEKLGTIKRNPYDRNLTIEEITEMAADADVLLTGWSTPMINKAAVEKMPNLKLIAHSAGSVASLVDPDVYETDVKVISGNDVFARSVAEGCLCYTLCALRRVEHYTNVMHSGGWKEPDFKNRGLIGKKVGIVGFGAISRYFLELIRWFKCEILIYSSHLSNEEAAKYGGRTASLEEIFSTCEVISIHASMTAKSAGMINRELLSMLKPNALLVNTARGGVIDEEAMFEMLLNGKFYAALDVYAKEPPLKDSPIRNCEHALVMPHMGGPTIDMREVVILEICDDIVRLQKGEPLALEISSEAAKRMTLA